jgi:hypothetical protein
MLRDHVIPKPETIVGYKLHQLVEGLTEGDAPLFLDRGKSLLIRTEKKITETGTAVEIPSGSSIIGFELRACVSKKVKGKHRYFPVSNYQIRHGWLRTKGEQFGFEPLTVTCSCEMKKLTDGGSRSFQIDHTDFAGILKVFDEQKFKKAMETGVGSTARAFGYGMLIL